MQATVGIETKSIPESKPAAQAVQAIHLEFQLQRQLGSRVRNLQILLKDAGMVLKGTALSYHAKQLAQHAAMRLGNLPVAANEIQVDYEAQPLPDLRF